MDLETRRKKQRALMVKMAERKVRSRAQQLYETRGQGEGRELQDWFQAESEVLENSTVALLFRRTKESSTTSEQADSSSDYAAQDSSTCETPA